MPNKSYVSSLINNENYAKPSDRCGPGLVQLGYVKPGHKQKGFNQTNTYYLTTPAFIDGRILRPDGSETDVRLASSKREANRAYKARKDAEKSTHEARHSNASGKNENANQLSLPLFDTYSYLGEKYTRADCEIDLLNWQNGFARDVPDAAYSYFEITVGNCSRTPNVSRTLIS